MEVGSVRDSLAQRRGHLGASGGSVSFAWAGLVASAGAVAFALLGCGKAAPLTGAAPPKARAQAAQVERVQRAPQRHEASIHFMTFAANALLLPLLDDDWPPRWADPSLSFDCDAGDVQVDGAPLDIGAPVHRGSFTVRWHMEHCTPFEGLMAVTGDVELRVEPIDGGYQMVVQPANLVVASAQGHDVLNQPFTARLSLGR